MPDTPEAVGQDMATTPEVDAAVHEISVDEDSLTFWGKVKDIARAAREDFGNTDGWGKLKIVGYVGTLGYEIFLGNEVVAPMIGGRAMDASHGIGGIALTGLLTGGFVAAEQLGAGWFARKTTQEFPKVSDRAYENTKDDNEDESHLKPFAELPKLKQLYYSGLFGTNFVVPREGIATEDLSDERLQRVSRLSAAIMGTTVAVISATTDAVEQQFPHNEVVHFISDHFIKNPYFWLTAGGIMLGVDKIKNVRRRKQKEAAANEPTDHLPSDEQDS